MKTTIAAISTAYGESGIGVIRLSGPEAKSILSLVFKPSSKRGDGEFEFEPRYMYHGYVTDPQNGKRMDEALAVFMEAPRSYTGEDVAEIQCHGSLIALREVLELCLRCGAEPAARGEFTKRAFLNGPLDLSQAEAVIDLVKARSSAAYSAALKQASGSLSHRVEGLRNELKELLVFITAELEYPDEDLEEINRGKLKDSLSAINDELKKLIDTADEGRIVREGLGVAIVGRPNVGKSSLMNCFLRADRSIVSHVPGTTRDTVEEQASIRGISMCFTDTAGIRETEDFVESLGIERSKQAFDRADLILLVIDSSCPLQEEDRELLRMIEGRPAIVVLNKEDLNVVVTPEELPPGTKSIRTSLSEGSGFTELEDAIEDFVSGGRLRREEDVLVTNARHLRLLRLAVAEIEQALSILKNDEALDFIEFNLSSAFGFLGEISGTGTSDEVINEIFERFCLGK